MTEAPHDTDVIVRLREIVDNADAGKVFAAPIAQGDTIMLPVAKIGSGGGGGSGTGPAEAGDNAGGVGGGFGLSAIPLGVYVLRDGKVKWMPAVDINKIVLGGQLVGVTALLVARSVLQAYLVRRRRRFAARAKLARLARRRRH